MVQVRMLRNKLGSNDGYTTKHYDKDETYEVSEALADMFVGEKVAELVVGEKSKGDAPENKAKKGAPENKAD